MSDSHNDDTERVAKGVDDLISRLRDEGVEKGREEAKRIVEEAEQRRRDILAEAEAEAQRRKDNARKEVEQMKATAHQALHTAARDTVLTLRQQMVQRFSEDVRRLVSHEMREEDVFRRLILKIAGRARDALDETPDQEIEIVLPRRAPSLQELRQDPRSLRNDDLTRLVLAMTGDMLREGVSFRVSDDSDEGIRVVATQSGLEFDLTDKAMAELLLQHLQPRFQALLEGIVK